MDPSENPLSPKPQAPQLDNLSVANLRTASEPYFKTPEPMQYSKYNLARPDSPETDQEPGSHYASALPGVQPSEQENYQPVAQQIPPPVDRVPSEKPRNSKKVLIFGGVGIIVLALLIGGGILIYPSLNPTKKEVTEPVSTTTYDESNSETPTESEDATTDDTSSSTPATQESGIVQPTPDSTAPAVEDNNLPVTPDTEAVTNSPVPDKTVVDTSNDSEKVTSLAQAGPPVNSALANFALAIMIYALARACVIKLRKKYAN